MMKSAKSVTFLTAFLLLTGCLFRQDTAAVAPPAESNESKNVESPTPTPTPTAKTDVQANRNAESLKPQDWFILTENSDGDINGDGRNDLIAVYSRDNPQTEKAKVPDEDGEAARLLVIALSNADGTFKPVFSGSQVVLCRNCGGMLDNVVPVIKIVNRNISVDQTVLATSEVNFHLEIAFKKNNSFVIVKGTIKNTERRTGKTQKSVVKPMTPLDQFDVGKY